MDAEHIGFPEQRVFVHRRDAQSRGVILAQVLTPGDHVHRKRLPESGNLAALFAQADDPEGLARQARPHSDLPAAIVHDLVLQWYSLADRHDQRPGELGCEIAQHPCAANRHVVLARGIHVYGQIAHSGRDEQSQVVQAIQL